MPDEQLTREPIPAIYILGPDTSYPEYRDNLLKAFAGKKLQEGKDFIIIGDGLTQTSEENLRKEIKGRIGANTRIFCDGHGLVKNINGVRKHTIQILEEETTEYLLNILQDEAKEEYKEEKETKTRPIPIYVDILSCYGGQTKGCIKNLVSGSVLQSHATDSHVSYADQNLQTAAVNIARHCEALKKPNFDMRYELAKAFMRNMCLTIETHNISYVHNDNINHHTSRSPDRVNIFQEQKEFRRYIRKEKFPKFFEEFVTKVYNEEEIKALEEEAKKISTKKYFKASEYNLSQDPMSKKNLSNPIYNLGLFGADHGIPVLTNLYLQELSKYPDEPNTFLPTIIATSSFEEIEKYYHENTEMFLRNINTLAPSDARPRIFGKTPLIIAIENNKFMLAEFLLEKGANADTSSREYLYPLMYAAAVKNHEAAFELSKLLIEKGANVNRSNIDGRTCLHVACKSKNEKIASLLIEKGASVTQPDKNGNTALHVAVLDNNYKMAKLLIEKGADVFAGNKEGKTPLSLPMENISVSTELNNLLSSKANEIFKAKAEKEKAVKAEAGENKHQKKVSESRKEKTTKENPEKKSSKTHSERHTSKKDHHTTEKTHKSHRDVIKESKKEPKSPNK